MLGYRNLIIAFVAASALSGCARYVTTNTVTYHANDATVAGSIKVKPLNEEQENSLVFKAISRYLEEKLIAAGFNESKAQQSEYYANIQYSIDDGTKQTMTQPIYGQVGSGSVTTYNDYNTFKTTGAFMNTTITPTQYGVVDVKNVSTTTYKREVKVDIWRQGVKSEKVYELKATSVGDCGRLDNIIYTIIDAMFENFPGISGQTQNIQLEWAGKC